MTDFLNWMFEFGTTILTMIGAVTLFLAWSYFSEKKYERADAVIKKKIGERLGIIFSAVIILFILLTVWASISSVFF